MTRALLIALLALGVYGAVNPLEAKWLVQDSYAWLCMAVRNM